MNLELFDMILTQVGQHAEIIILTGIGEALYHKHAKEIFKRLKNYKNFQLEFTTNGKLMDEDWIQLLAKMRCTVTFSVDGVDANTYSFNRPAGDFFKIEYALHRARELELSSPNPATFPFKRRINFLVMRSNMHQMPEMILWAKNYGVELLVFILMNNWGCPEEFWMQQNPLNYRDELIKYLEKAKTLASENNVNLVMPLVSQKEDTLPIYRPIREKRLKFQFKPQGATELGFPRFEDRYCHIPFHSIYFRADGKASFCCASWHKELGDTRKQSVKSIWNNFPFRIGRIAMSIGSHTSYCRMCDLPYGLAKGNPRDIP
jgi:MoaA/NifB/PqqE/SkfB family radical SAM enzyme